MEKNSLNVLEFFLDGKGKQAVAPVALQNESGVVADQVQKGQERILPNIYPTNEQSRVGDIHKPQPGLSPPVTLNNPYVSYESIKREAEVPTQSAVPTQSPNFYYEKNVPFGTPVFSVYPADPVAPQPVPLSTSGTFQPPFNSTMVDGRFTQQPIISPFFTQNNFSQFPPSFGLKRPMSVQPMNYFFQPPMKPTKGAIATPNSTGDAYILPATTTHPRIPTIPSKSLPVNRDGRAAGSSQPYKDSDGIASSSLEETKEMRLTRDRAAARLRRMRKKANIEITEMKIEFIKNRINALRKSTIPDNRSGLFNSFDCGGGLIFSYNERTNDYLFLMEIWKSLFQRQKDCYLLASILLWTLVADNADAPSESQRVKLRSRLNLSEDQKVKILSLVQTLDNLRKRLLITNWCITTLSLDLNFLMNPVVARANDILSSALTSSQLQKLHVFFKQNEGIIAQLPTSPAQRSIKCDLPPNLSFIFQSFHV